jgi:hypothetical protein
VRRVHRSAVNVPVPPTQSDEQINNAAPDGNQMLAEQFHQHWRLRLTPTFSTTRSVSSSCTPCCYTYNAALLEGVLLTAPFAQGTNTYTYMCCSLHPLLRGQTHIPICVAHCTLCSGDKHIHIYLLLTTPFAQGQTHICISLHLRGFQKLWPQAGERCTCTYNRMLPAIVYNIRQPKHCFAVLRNCNTSTRGASPQVLHSAVGCGRGSTVT